jgi:hypothetical protein
MFWFLPIQPWTFVHLALALAISAIVVLLLQEARRWPDAWYRRFDRGAPWQRRSWGI